MKLKETNNKITDQAWDRLYMRLDRDGLLPENKVAKKASIRTSLVRWGAVAAILCVCAISIFVIRGQKTSHNGMLSPYNEY